MPTKDSVATADSSDGFWSEGTPVSPTLIEAALTVKPTTFEPKKHSKLPSRSLQKRGRARRATKARIKLERKNRRFTHHSSYLEDDYEDNSTLSLPSLGEPDNRNAGFLFDHDDDEFTNDLARFPYSSKMAATRPSATRHVGLDDHLDNYIDDPEVQDPAVRNDIRRTANSLLDRMDAGNNVQDDLDRFQHSVDKTGGSRTIPGWIRLARRAKSREAPVNIQFRENPGFASLLKQTGNGVDSYGGDRKRLPRPRWILMGMLGILFIAVVAIVAVFISDTTPKASGEDLQDSYAIRSIPTRPQPDMPPVIDYTTETPHVNDKPWDEDRVTELLSWMTHEAVLNNPNTPQGRALKWLLDDVNGQSMNSPRITQRYVLATLYYATITDKTNWYYSANWLSSEHECTWFGISCGSDGSLSFPEVTGAEESGDQVGAFKHSVTVIRLESNNLHGNIPKEIGELTNLAQLHLYDNFLRGTIPASITTWCTRLHTLYLDNNFLVGHLPVGVGNLMNLVNVDLSNNSLGGTMPNGLDSLTNLVHLRLDNNVITGQFPTSLLKLTNMEVLTLGNNEIKGGIPGGMERFQKLVILRMHENELSGKIPGFDSPALQELHLDSNALTGPLPIVDQATNLREIRLERNKFSGSIPVPKKFMDNLELLWLDHNELTGSISQEFGNLQNLESFRIHGNDLSGTIPSSVCLLKDGVLEQFQATCDGSNANLDCDCCTECD